jgi:hypothetical protein
LAMTIIESTALELLTPFFEMTKSDVDAILSKIKIIEAGKPVTAKTIADMRSQTERRIRRAFKAGVGKLNFKELIIGDAEAPTYWKNKKDEK